MLHVDVHKIDNILDGGGWRYLGRTRQANVTGPPPPGKPAGVGIAGDPNSGKACMPTVINDHFRVAVARICEDETKESAVAVLRAAVTWFAERGVTIERVLSENGSGLPLTAVA